MKLKNLIFGAVALATIAGGAAQAATLLNFGVGPSGFGDQALTPNDDQSSSLLNLPFSINYFGNNYNSFYVNNNGNVTFNGPVGNYTPIAFPIANQPMIAPYWGDVDTRGGGVDGSNNVYVYSPNADSTVVTWDRVGYYSYHTNLLNSFQLVLTNRADTGAGNFDVSFIYQNLEWTTGDASGGTGGFGGTPAQAGYDAGDQTNYFVLPGSRTAAVTNLQNTSNTGVPGVWTFAVRNGQLPGTDPSNPVLPVASPPVNPVIPIAGLPNAQTQVGWNFTFNVGPNTTGWIDPAVAIGYEYIVNSGPLITSIVLPTGIGDNLYDLYLWDGSQYVDSGQDLTGGTVFDFTTWGAHPEFANGINRFVILGIETSANVDPTDTQAFVTGLTFTVPGIVDVNQNPISIDIPGDTTVPEPASLGLTALGLAAALRLRRKRLTA